MKIAIMGAGMAGLSCAITLEKHGVTPYIFEKRASVGDRFVSAEGMFHILNRPVQDCIPYLQQEFGIHLNPLTKACRIEIHSKHEKGAISGDIGYLNIRGRHEHSYERQLQEQLLGAIEYHSEYDYETLCKKFDAVVLATGDAEYACRLGNFRSDFTGSVRGVTVTGSFQADTPHVWFNCDVMPKGYGWVIPYSDQEANVVMFSPDYPRNIKQDRNEMWNQFYELVTHDLNQQFRITDRFEFKHYIVGICNQPKLENTYFTGNCFGAVSPGFGFGQFISILTGVYSAYDICGLGDYAKLSKPLRTNYENSLILRRFLENMKDDNFDFIAKNVNIKLISRFVNAVCDSDSRMDLLKHATPLMKLFNRLQERKNKQTGRRPP
ncbi:MAG: FAD-binding protein [Christensenellales bacterium]|jgi:flavin-dependent dehydrogenase